MKIKEIVKAKLKGCGEEFERLKYSKGLFKIRKELIWDICIKNSLCPTCKATLTGMETIIKESLEFLEKQVNYCEDMHSKVGASILDDFNKVNRKRVIDYQDALKLIEEVK